MKEYKKLASRVALFVAVASLAIQILVRSILLENSFPLALELIFALIFGFVAFSIMEWFPKLALRDKSLCGLYFITYVGTKDKLASVINIDYNTESTSYAIDIYDYISKDDRWYAVSGPQSLDNVYYDLHSRGIHLISNDKSKNTFIFIKFRNTKRPDNANIVRYGSIKPFDKSLSGELIRLNNRDFCIIYNTDQEDGNYCERRKRDRYICRMQDHTNCKHKNRSVLQWVRDKSKFINIPEALYYDFVDNQEPIEQPTPRKRNGNNEYKHKVDDFVVKQNEVSIAENDNISNEETKTDEQIVVNDQKGE